MNIIDIEIEEIRNKCENVVPNSKIIACLSTPAPLVRVQIQNKYPSRELSACLRFPSEYPRAKLLVELKSKYLSSKFLDGLAALCEAEANKQLGKPQCLIVLQFIQAYVQENPLCVCFEEIQQLRSDIGAAANEQLKLKKRASTLILTARGEAYFYRIRAVVPDDYPASCVQLQQPESNLPAILQRYLNGQSQEIARQCVEAPLFKSKDAKQQQVDFQPRPSVYLTLKFCSEALRDFPRELCPICDTPVLPPSPDDLVLDDSKDVYVERVYCGHLYHQGCLKRHLQEPPFLKTGKLCPAKRRHPRSDARSYLRSSSVNADIGETCGLRLAHDRWVINAKVAEARWAQKQARARELQEVVDFLK